MGPLFFRAENANNHDVGLVATFELQWGRSFSERRTYRLSQGLREQLRASMGPLFFRAENGDRVGGVWYLERASMGPLFFRAENAVFNSLSEQLPGLQWGRSFSERRTRGKLLPSERVNCFNGAALFQSGERRIHSRSASASVLQWGRSFSERRTWRDCVVRLLGIELQWGRSISERRTTLEDD